MKKLFSILATALIAFSFTSCNQSTVEMNGFKITVDSITATSAHIAVEPTDTTAYYFVTLSTVEDYKVNNLDSMLAFLNLYADYGLEVLAKNGFVHQGTIDGPASNLAPRTDYLVVAFVVEMKDSAIVAPKGVATKSFRTSEMIAKEAKELNLNASFIFYPAEVEGEEASMQILAEDNAAGIDVTFALQAQSFNGKLSEKNFYTDGAYCYNYAEWGNGDDDWTPFVTMDFTGSFNADSTVYTFSGNAIGENAVKYTFSNVAATVYAQEKAPARKNGLKKSIKLFGKAVK